MLGLHLVIHWLRLHAPNAGGLGLIPAGQGTRSYMPQLGVCKPQLKKKKKKSHVLTIPCAATKTWHSQINFKKTD